MKVLKEGKIDIEIYRATCWKCKAQLEYTKEDIQSSFRNDIYVECPCCSSYVDHEKTNLVGVK